MKKELIRDSAQIIAGNFLVALGVNAFILPNDVLTGGLAGVAVALQPLVAIEPTLFINAATIVLFGIGAVILGRQFALKTMLSTICYPLFISLLSWGLRNGSRRRPSSWTSIWLPSMAVCSWDAESGSCSAAAPVLAAWISLR